MTDFVTGVGLVSSVFTIADSVLSHSKSIGKNLDRSKGIKIVKQFIDKTISNELIELKSDESKRNLMEFFGNEIKSLSDMSIRSSKSINSLIEELNKNSKIEVDSLMVRRIVGNYCRLMNLIIEGNISEESLFIARQISLAEDTITNCIEHTNESILKKLSDMKNHLTIAGRENSKIEFHEVDNEDLLIARHFPKSVFLEDSSTYRLSIVLDSIGNDLLNSLTLSSVKLTAVYDLDNDSYLPVPIIDKSSCMARINYEALNSKPTKLDIYFDNVEFIDEIDEEYESYVNLEIELEYSTNFTNYVVKIMIFASDEIDCSKNSFIGDYKVESTHTVIKDLTEI
ncbi:hypothetical protein [Fusibacter sp. JL216-2]|uniref:hypothetical protein n=1 Tax=Fusibacter sp. JL216-2 TaxID=3071453 RepID=UPI003D3574D9